MVKQHVVVQKNGFSHSWNKEILRKQKGNHRDKKTEDRKPETETERKKKQQDVG